MLLQLKVLLALGSGKIQSQITSPEENCGKNTQLTRSFGLAVGTRFFRLKSREIVVALGCSHLFVAIHALCVPRPDLAKGLLPKSRRAARGWPNELR